MKHFIALLLLISLSACEQSNQIETPEATNVESAVENRVTQIETSPELSPVLIDVEDQDNFQWVSERFADIQIIRYQLPGFDQLSLQQQKLVYFLVQAGLAGRDIMWDQNYRHNLIIRRAIEAILELTNVDQSSQDWQNFNLYARQVFFANGIHHHYSGDKFTPLFSQTYFEELLAKTDISLNEEALKAIFDPEFDAKKITLDPAKDIVKDSAVNYYDPDISDEEVTAFYAALTNAEEENPVLYGLNSKVIRQDDGSLAEKVWYADGMYGEAISEIISWLEKAVTVAENPAQGDALKLLIDYYKTGDLKTWDEYNIAWVNATEGDVDYIHSFIEVYQDPKAYKGAFENIVQIKDFEASERMQVVANNAQWFEDNSTTDPAHKKDSVTGISYNVVNVAGESGDASPSTPVGVNLPNSNWIRALHGSKSISLGNIVNAYEHASAPGLLTEFAHDVVEIKRNEAHKELSGKLRTALHEVIGHASGKLEDGVATPKETLKNYASALEEARADLVALYFILDEKLVEMGLLPSLEVGKASYDSFILNGLMLQLRRIEPGKNIEQAHMRNRQTIAAWVYEKGFADGVIVKESRDGNTYFDIKDYEALRELFGQLLNEVQRIKSQGDFAAGRDLIENYGVQVDQAIHAEVIQRAEKLNIAPYGGFINPRLVARQNEMGEIINIDVEYPNDFVQQMLEYGENYSFLPNYN
ncbi:MAG: dipeptidyl peptidase 3 [Acidiferrobacterales bacterium]|nr:dipeptidyl peptidase 3 [Acidiferrobacterales bacterium]